MSPAALSWIAFAEVILGLAFITLGSYRKSFRSIGLEALIAGVILQVVAVVFS